MYQILKGCGRVHKMCAGVDVVDGDWCCGAHGDGRWQWGLLHCILIILSYVLDVSGCSFVPPNATACTRKAVQGEPSAELTD